MATLKVKRHSATAKLPTRATCGSAGYDLYAAYPTIIPANGNAMIASELSLSLPVGYYGRIAPRSGLSSKHSLDVGAGVIDPDFTGKVFVLMFNHGHLDYAVSAGDRVAQLLLERYITPEVEEVELLPTVEEARGAPAYSSLAAVLQVKKLVPQATVPTKASPGSAGYELYAASYVEVPANGRALIPLGLAIKMPMGCYGRISERTAFSVTWNTGVGAGVIDPDYEGELSVLLLNHASRDLVITPGTKVAQLILECIITPAVEEVESLPTSTTSERGASGFGSTGI